VAQHCQSVVILSDCLQNGENPYYTTLINGTFANGTEIPKGSYKVLLRALRVNGDASKEDDYDSWLSPVIGLF
jgi:hypothetical protein